MIRKAFTMRLHSGQQEEYQRRHEALWEDLKDVLVSQGVHNYSIFLDPETSQLLAYAEIEDEARWQAISRTEVCQRWWRYMSEIMPSHSDGSPISETLTEVFHLD